jgi:hypothetical protein
VDGRAATATLIFLPRTARTWVISSNLVAYVWRVGSTGAGAGFLLLPKVPISGPKRRTKSSRRKKGHSLFRGLSSPRFFLHLPTPQISKHHHGRMVVLGVVVARCHSPAHDKIHKWTPQRSGTNRLRVRIARRNSLSIYLPSPTNLP